MKARPFIQFVVLANLLLVGFILFLLLDSPAALQTGMQFFAHSSDRISASSGSVSKPAGMLSAQIFEEKADSSLTIEEKNTLQMPVAIIAMDPRVFVYTDQQVAEWEALQEEFINEVGNKLPTSPCEWERWEAASQLSDEMFRIKFGEEIYQKQLQAAAQENQVAFQ